MAHMQHDWFVMSCLKIISHSLSFCQQGTHGAHATLFYHVMTEITSHSLSSCLHDTHVANATFFVLSCHNSNCLPFHYQSLSTKHTHGAHATLLALSYYAQIAPLQLRSCLQGTHGAHATLLALSCHRVR